ncbi:polyisoprenoid-binding protein YceI [Haloferula luteola]|uniref:Polyisoprenoid-binding protein YceI n=1 Tax=Haloferula luteola TaxID=595692 RepID=A0A840VCM7_9BACT|nr:YceI family protein [Haloferula luteola]MBB5353284.1 polyisoprenoid-binding protein YceI [Haloferula luteola]
MKSVAITLAPAALVALTLVSCENPADKTADASVKEAAPVAEASGTRYVLTDASTVTFVGSKVTGSHEGGFKEISGDFTVDAAGDVTGGTVTIDMNSVWTDADKLTDHLKTGDFFLVTEHPESRFTITQIEKTDTGYSVSGNLLMRGVEKNITFPATGSKDGETVKVNAEFDINRKDWGIVYAGKADDLIRDEVVIRFDLTAQPEA